MKKKASLILGVALSLSMYSTVFAQDIVTVAEDVKVYHTNKDTFMSFQNDIINVNGTNFFPMRELLNKLGVSNEDIIYHGDTRSISFSNENYDAEFVIGSSEYIQNEVVFEMPVEPFVTTDGVTYLPIRYVANSLGSKVGYDEDLKQILVTDITSEYTVYRESDLPQFSDLVEGETLASINTNYGDITVRFFPKYAPKAVENFLTLAEEGYYDEVTFHRVINDFVIQGGDPTGTGAGGDSIYGEDFEDEISLSLRHFSGALAMANAGVNTNGSQFYIVETDDMGGYVSELEWMKNNPYEIYDYDSGILIQDIMSPIIAQKYIELGGTPFLDGGYTIFGHVVEGMEVVHLIADVETNTSDKPIEDVIINSIIIEEYSK